MHGRVKSVAATQTTPAELAAQQKKATTYAELSRVLLSRRKSGDKSAETFELLAKMLRSNPDFYTLWNYRKDILVAQCLEKDIPLAEALAHRGDRSFAVPLALGEPLLEAELSLTADAIRKNPKCYGAWFHRQWMVTHFDFVLETELDLCAALLTADQRNFHCWNYRRHITTLLQPTPATIDIEIDTKIDTTSTAAASATVSREFCFSTDKLHENFSNYSAFHHRSVCLRALPAPALSPAFRALLTTELSLVENAVFTEPDDQSAWWYRQFLFAWLLERAREALGDDDGMRATEAPKAQELEFLDWVVALVREQVILLEGLLEAEEGCRWAKGALVASVGVLAALHQLPGARACSAGDELERLRPRRRELLASLLDTDPAHRQRYERLLQQA